MSESWSAQMRKGFVEMCVLAVLRRDPAYGYAILKALNAEEAFTYTESTLYPALGRLTADGLLTSRKENSPNGPPRRYYRLTPKGHERLAEMQAYWASLKRGVERVVGGNECDPW